MQNLDTPSLNNSVPLLSPKNENSDASTNEIYLRTQLNLAEEELSKLDVNLAMILDQRSHLIKRISEYHASLGLFNKLPFDIIGEILKLNMPKLQPFPLPEGKNDPRLELTQISSHWRRGAFAFNELWNHIHIQLNVCDRDSQLKLVAAWLRQCSSMVITLKISGLTAAYDADCLLNEVVVPHAHRISSLDSMLTDASYYSINPFDVLTNLNLVYQSRKANSGGPMIAPSLRHLTMTKITRHQNHRLMEFLPGVPWSQLTSLNLAGSFTFSHIYDILFQCKSMEVCRLDSVNGISSHVARHSADLPQLKSLWIKFDASALFHDLFSLVVPNLAYLSISHPPQSPEILEEFSAFLNGIKGTLRHFEIIPNSSDTDAASTDQVMHMLPFVTRFTSTRRGISLDTLAKIGTGELLPGLEVLDFVALIRDRIEGIVDALIPRQSDRKSRLRDVYIHTDQRYCSGERPRELHSRGINLWAVYRYPHMKGTGVGGAVGTWEL